MRKTAILAVLVAVVSTSAWTETARVTFTKDVLPILQENCQTCHRPSGQNMAGMVALRPNKGRRGTRRKTSTVFS